MERVFSVENYASLAREAVADGCVLIQNENQVLPLTGVTKVALFGRTQMNYYKSGTGSGGLVNTSYVTGIYEALEQDDEIELNQKLRATYEEWVKEHPFDAGAGWAQEPWFQEEMEISRDLLKETADTSDVAIIIIGRTAGEDRDNLAEEGSYLLTALEKKMLKDVCASFEKTIVLLNVGNIIDMEWIDECHPSAVMYVWQGGQEGGNGVLDVLKGTVNPAGCLPDTIAYDVADYPSTENHGNKDNNYYCEDIYVGYRYFETFAKDKVRYPFGYGLSYTTFDMKLNQMDVKEDTYSFTVDVTNTGAVAGKTAVMLYLEAPQGNLGKPSRSLCAFGKTEVIEPQQTVQCTMNFKQYDIASYDDSGATGHKSCYVLEAGDYRFFLGTNVREAKEVACHRVDELIVVEQLQEAMAPIADFRRMKPSGGVSGSYGLGYEVVPKRTVNPMERRAFNQSRMTEISYTGNQGYRLQDVAEGRVTMEQFIGQLSDMDLSAIAIGEGMCPSGVTPGVAGSFGGVTQSLRDMGIPKAACADGPSGIRMDCGSKAFAMPNGTCLACTFDEGLMERLYEYEGMELRMNHVDSLLGPGMNIHRSPLNGRNFEYFSEDPLVTGKLSAAQVRAMNRYGVTGTIKHFACNNQEYMRRLINAVVSERALREIYLKGYEIAVKEGGAFLIMTSYNPINGIFAAGNYDLLTTILRGEWGFDGMVMTDWWATAAEEGEEGKIAHTAVMVRAQNDVYMVLPTAEGSDTTTTALEGLRSGRLSRAELQRSAMNICNTVLRLPAYQFMLGHKTELDEQLEKYRQEENEDMDEIIEIQGEAGKIVIDPSLIHTGKGVTNLFQVIPAEGGIYELELECCVEEGQPLAQIPVSIFKDHGLVKSISLVGTDTEWRTEIIPLSPVMSASFFLKFYFGQGGMKIRSCVMKQKCSMEELQKRMQAGGAGPDEISED